MTLLRLKSGLLLISGFSSIRTSNPAEEIRSLSKALTNASSTTHAPRPTLINIGRFCSELKYLSSK